MARASSTGFTWSHIIFTVLLTTGVLCAGLFLVLALIEEYNLPPVTAAIQNVSHTTGKLTLLPDDAIDEEVTCKYDSAIEDLQKSMNHLHSQLKYIDKDIAWISVVTTVHSCMDLVFFYVIISICLFVPIWFWPILSELGRLRMQRLARYILYVTEVDSITRAPEHPAPRSECSHCSRTRG